jgi:hypothetical protein
LGWESELGIFEKGKKPGVIVLNSISNESKRII